MRLPRPTGAALAVIVAVAVAGASAGIGVISRLGQEARRNTAAKVLPLTVGEVARVTVSSEAGEAELTRERDGDWIAGPGTSEQSATLMFTFEERLFPLAAYRTVPRVEAEFGLDDPEITFTVEDTDGTERVVHLGAPTFTDGANYARRADAPKVYLVPRRMMDDLRSLVAGKRIDKENTLPDKIRKLDEAAKERADVADIGPWLQQSIDAGTPIPEGVE